MDRKKLEKFITDIARIDASPLSNDDVVKLAKFVIIAMSLETPMMARHHQHELGLTDLTI